MDKADLEYVRELLASTERLCQEVAEAIAEAKRLQAQVRLLHHDTRDSPVRRVPVEGSRQGGADSCHVSVPPGPRHGR